MITVDDLLEAFEGLTPENAQTIVDLISGTTAVNPEGDDRFPLTSEWVRRCYHTPPGPERAMTAIDELIGGFGVEGIQQGGKCIAEYSNQGDTYATTIVRDIETGEFLLTSYGDWLEAWEAEQCEENSLVSCGYCSHLTPLENDSWRDTTCESCGRNVSTGEVPKPDTTERDHAYARIVRLHRMVERSLFYREPPLNYSRVTRAIELLAKLVDEYDFSDSDRLWSIGESGACDLASLVSGAYRFYSDYHSGQWSDEYRVQCVLGGIFKPGPCTSGPEDDSTEQHMYGALQDISGNAE